MTSGSDCTCGRRSLGELAAEIQRDHMVGDRHHEAHVMLDQQHGHVAVVANPADQVAEHVDFLVVEAAGGLVEQQDLRLGSQRARQFDALLGAERQAGNHGVGDVVEVEIADDLVDALVELGLAAADPGQSQRVADDVAVGAGMGADPDVVEHRKVGKQRDVLEGAADADFGDPVRRARQDALAFHQNVARARLIEPAEAIEQRRLAGAVRPDQAEDLALVHVERHAVQRDDAAEHDADVANREQGVLSLRELCLHHRAPPRCSFGPERPCEFSAGHSR